MDKIDTLKKEGISYTRINFLLEIGVSDTHFMNLRHRARQKEPGKITAPRVELKNQHKARPTVETKDNVQRWIQAFNFYQETRITPVLDSVIGSLEKAGWNVDNYHLLKKQHSIMTMNQLIDLVGSIKAKKFRKNIFKDGKPCF